MKNVNAAIRTTERRYWLMKTEPGCFSLDDLKSRPGETEHWDGVRNYQARNLLRDEIKEGDGVLFYHSNIAEPAIVGLARIVRSGYPDHTALDPGADHFDAKASVDNPIWYMVDVHYVAHFDAPVTRALLQRHPLLVGMEVLRRGSRLSVQPVMAAEWRIVLELGGCAGVKW